MAFSLIDYARLSQALHGALQSLQTADPVRAHQATEILCAPEAVEQADMNAVLSADSQYLTRLAAQPERLSGLLTLLGLDAKAAGVRLRGESSSAKAGTTSDKDVSTSPILFPQRQPAAAKPSNDADPLASAITKLLSLCETLPTIALYRMGDEDILIQAVTPPHLRRLTALLNNSALFQSPEDQTRNLQRWRDKGAVMGLMNDGERAFSIYFVEPGKPHWNKLHADLLVYRLIGPPAASDGEAGWYLPYRDIPIDIPAAAKHNRLLIPDVLERLVNEPDCIACMHPTEMRALIEITFATAPEIGRMALAELFPHDEFISLLLTLEPEQRRDFFFNLARHDAIGIANFLTELPRLDDALELLGVREMLSEAPSCFMRAHLEADNEAESRMRGKAITPAQMRYCREEIAAWTEDMQEEIEQQREEGGIRNLSDAQERFVNLDLVAILDCQMSQGDIRSLRLQSRQPLRKLLRILDAESAEIIRGEHRTRWWEKNRDRLALELASDFAALPKP